MELALLGSVILEATRTTFVCAQLGIEPDTFYVPAHRMIYQQIESMGKAGTPIDLLTLSSALKAEGRLDQVGGDLYLERMTENATPSYAQHYATEIDKMWTRRKGIAAARLAEDMFFVGELDNEKILSDAQAQLMAAGSNNTVQIKTLGDVRKDKIDQWRKAKGCGYTGIPCSFTGLNRIMGGWRMNVMSILAGYRGLGKSTLARQEAVNLARDHNIPVGLISIEDPMDIASSRAAAYHAGVSAFKLDTGNARDETIDHIDQKWEEIGNIPLYIASDPMTISQVDNTIKIMVARYGVKIIFLDHIQCVHPLALPRKTRNETLGEYSQALVGLTKRLPIHICILSQLSRGPERDNRIPKLSDIRDSGTLEQDARQVILFYTDPKEGNYIARVEKNNFGASKLNVNLNFKPDLQRFEEMVPGADEEMLDEETML